MQLVLASGAMRRLRLLSATAVLPAALLIACGRPGPTTTFHKSVELDAAESVATELHISAGELHVEGGAPGLLESTFTYNVPEWEPVVDYRRDGSRGVLRVEQPNFSARFANTQNTWRLKLNDRTPIALTANVGAGESTLMLGSLNLESVEVDVGAGEVTVDLRGTPMRSYDVQVNASVGQATIRLPKTVAIVATATSGIGGTNVSGLEKRGSTWVNPGHEQDPVVIHVDVKGGVGQIDLSAE
jgi:hypothetical protein